MACNWPTAVSGQFKGSFPGPATLHIRALRRSSEPLREERAAWWIGGPHTLRTARLICVFFVRDFGLSSLRWTRSSARLPCVFSIDSTVVIIIIIFNHNYVEKLMYLIIILHYLDFCFLFILLHVPSYLFIGTNRMKRQELFNTQLFLKIQLIYMYILDYRLSFSHDNGFRTVHHRRSYLVREKVSRFEHRYTRTRSHEDGRGTSKGGWSIYRAGLFLGEKFNFTKISVW